MREGTKPSACRRSKLGRPFVRALEPHDVVWDCVRRQKGQVALETLVEPGVARARADEDGGPPAWGFRAGRCADFWRNITAKRDHARGVVTSEQGGAICHGRALRKTNEDDRRNSRRQPIDDAVDVFDVVADRQFPIFARHPARDDLLLIARVEAMQRLRRRDSPPVDARKLPRLLEDVVCRLPVPVKRDDETSRGVRGVVVQHASVCRRFAMEQRD